ncbi:MAG: hypothetical protein ACRDQ5_26615 [Sciscionella sp.]
MAYAGEGSLPASASQRAPVADGIVLDGFTVSWLPDGIGSMVSNFEYEWEDVSFRTQVWESGPDADGGYQTDLNILVLRGEKLRDIESLHSYLADYQERDPRQWHLERFEHDDHPGYHGDDQAFWLAAPGVGVVVKVYGDRFDRDDVIDVVGGMHELR